MSTTQAIRVLFWWAIFWICIWTAVASANEGARTTEVPCPVPADGVDALRAPLEPTRQERMETRDSLVARWAWAYQIPPHIAIAISHVENLGADSMAVSSAGAVGLMQVLPRAHAWTIIRICGAGVSIFEQECNVRVGLHILAGYKQRYRTWPQALRAYHGSLNLPEAGREYVQLVTNHLHGETLR